MIIVERLPGNPILAPDPKSEWEAEAVFNWCPVTYKQKTYALYRAVSKPQTIHGQTMSVSTIGCAESTDGVTFTNRRQLITPQY